MLEDLVKSIRSLFKLKKVILFGSYAWGNPSKESDYDLFIIMDSNEERPAKRAIEILKKCHPGNISLDLLVRTPSEVNERIKIGDVFMKKILEEGKVLYDDSSR